MYKNVLVPMALDHDISPRTIEVAHALAAKDGKILAIHVVEDPKGVAKTYIDPDDVQKGHDKLAAHMKDKLKDYPDIEGKLIAGHPARTIVEYANANKVDCIVIGSHKPGLSDYFIGSTASRVVRHANCAVHVLR